MSQDKDEILAMAHEADDTIRSKPFTAEMLSFLERFATLCRAPLVAENAALKQAHEINADTLNAMQVEIDDWKARALKSEQAEVRLWDSQWVNVVNHDNCYAGWSKEDAINHAVKMTEQLIASNVDQNKLPSVATPPSAVPVVRQMVVALDLAAPYFTHNNQVTAAIAAGKKFIKEGWK